VPRERLRRAVVHEDDVRTQDVRRVLEEGEEEIDVAR
jgi:hypothetical protein